MAAENKLGCPVCGLELEGVVFELADVEVTAIEWSLKCEAKGSEPFDCANLKALLAGLPGKHR
jgi:hypothetical protein